MIKHTFMMILALCIFLVNPGFCQTSVTKVPDVMADSPNPDYSDVGFHPVASHRFHSLEWLGLSVNEEDSPRNPDQFNDGLTVLTPRRFSPGKTVILAVVINTRWSIEPHMFNGSDFLTALGVWIDWNHDSHFKREEMVFNNKYKVPFEINNKKSPNALIKIPVRVPGSYQQREIRIQDGERDGSGTKPPPIRIRVGFIGVKQELPIGGKLRWGEVEDHPFFINDLAYFMDQQNSRMSFTSLSPHTQDFSRFLLGSNIALLSYSPAAEINYQAVVKALDIETLILFYAEK